MTSLLLTGSTGFVGERLCARFQEGLQALPNDGYQQLSHPVTLLTRFHGSLLDRDNVSLQIKQQKPDVILHLAAMSHVPTCNQQPENAWQVNVQGTLNVLQACVEHSPDTLVIYVGSSDCYGASFKTLSPVNEDTLLQPLNVYAASKSAADLMVAQYGMSGTLKTVRLRPFNHTGSSQRQDFVVPSFAAQIAAIEAGLQAPEIQVGNLDAERDFLDVDDVISAYFSVIAKRDQLSSGSVFNIASGEPRSIRSILDQLLALSDHPINVVTDPERLRPADISRVQGDSTLIRRLTGWQPKVPWYDTLNSILIQQRLLAQKTSSF